MTTPEKVGTAHVPTARNADFNDMLNILQAQQARTTDLVIPGDKLKFSNGMLVINQEVVLGEDGVTDPNGTYWPTQVFDDQLAAKLDITGAFLRRLRHGKVDKQAKTTAVPRLDLWDANVNGLLGGRKPKVSRAAFTEPGVTVREEFTVLREGIPADPRSFFVRLLQPENGLGVARAILSDKFARLDNFDGAMAMLKGIKDAGIDPDTLRMYGDLSETRMFVHVAAPEILAAAPGLLDGYRSPFDSESERGKRTGHALSMDERIELGRQFRETGRVVGGNGFYEPGQEPLVHAGFLLSNSEVGFGRWQVTPEITILRCSNGMTQVNDGFARQHVGGQQQEGHIKWSEDTMSKELELVTAKTRDVVRAVLSQEYLERTVTALERKAGKVVAEPETAIEVVAKRFAFSKEEQEGILRHFLLGGQLTSGGVMNAVTSYSQTINNPDAAHDLNARAVEAMEYAYARN